MTSPAELSKPRLLWTLFWEFFKIATFVVGGGFAILVAADDLFTRKYKWLSEDEIANVMALVQTVPGLTAGNIAIYIGFKLAGLAGAFCALTGVAMPSFLIISVIAMGFGFIPIDNLLVQGAFLGVRTAVAAISVAATLKVWKRSLRDFLQCLILVSGVCAILIFHVNPGWIVLGGVLIGPLYCMLLCRELPKAARDEEDAK